MKYVFWQNILSIHQAPFIRNLSQANDVILVVENSMAEQREKGGWHVPDFGNAAIIITSNFDEVKELIEDRDIIHVFSGFATNSIVKQAMYIALNKKIRFGVILEPFNSIGLKGKIRRLKYTCFRIKYNKALSFMLVTGDEGRRCYQKVGFSKEKIFDWGYFTENVDVKFNKVNALRSEKVSLIFIGSIDQRKNILSLIDIYGKLDPDWSTLKIIGKGGLESELESKVRDKLNVKYLGTVKNNIVSEHIASSDLLILPSIFDGWGAVVNEALMCGTPVIASNYCGASILLDGKDRGEVFNIEDNNLEEVLKKWIAKGKVSDEQRSNIKEWAEKKISGEASSHYFLEIMSNVFKEGERPVAPWIKNDT